jgi:hypothetical protein
VKKLCIEVKVCIQGTRKGIGWWKMGNWRLKGARENTEQGMCPMCSEEERWNRILRCKEIINWREGPVDKRFTSTEPQIRIRRIATIKGKDKLEKVQLYLSKYKKKWKRSVMKYEEK